MSLTSALSHWDLGASECQQLAALIANMVEDHCRATSSETIEQETHHDNQDHIPTSA